MDSKRLIVLGDRDTVSGMRLAGVREAYVVDERNADDVYGTIRDKTALFLITKQAAKALGPRVEELRRKTLVQIIPESSESYSVIRELIKDTVGFDLGA